MKTTIARVTLIPHEGRTFRWSIEGTVVAGNEPLSSPLCVQCSILHDDRGRWIHVFGSRQKALELLAAGKPFTRRLRLTTLGYDRTDRVVV